MHDQFSWWNDSSGNLLLNFPQVEFRKKYFSEIAPNFFIQNLNFLTMFVQY